MSTYEQEFARSRSREFLRQADEAALARDARAAGRERRRRDTDSTSPGRQPALAAASARLERLVPRYRPARHSTRTARRPTALPAEEAETMVSTPGVRSATVSSHS